MEGDVKGGGKVRSHDSLLSFRALCKGISSVIEKKVHDLRLINLSHAAHFKELQNYFEVYLLLMTFLKKWDPRFELSASFTVISVGHLPTQPHKDRVSIHMRSYKQIYGTKKTGQNGSLLFKKFTFFMMEAEGIMLFLLS